MKEEIKMEDIAVLKRDSTIFAVLLAATVVTIVPLFLYMDFAGIAIWIFLFGITMYYAVRIEKQKKIHEIQTYKEVVAFTEGKRLDEIEKTRESGKRPYQAVLFIIGSGLIAATVVIVMYLILFRI
ncbi:hypothetical protein [uncultured Robinsoniella sp.]|uniref:hypothetical protein n=1 Tax=uncultured Robinsoniella sp. TaxID=904190 RepID=UPI00374F4183